MGQEIEKIEPDRFIDKIKESWDLVLPSVCTPDRFARVALSCIRKNEKLYQAIQTKEGRASTAEAFMKCAELGIEPDGRRAYLIPYKNEVQLIIDYKGIAELAMRSGYVSNIHADKVCEKDDFVYNMGNIEKHIINFREERGEPYAYYAVVTFKDGTKKSEVMSKKEVDKIKERSAAWNSWLKYKKVCPWNTDYDEMAKKTVFKRLAKWIPQSPEVQRAIEIDDEDYKKTPVIIDNPVDPEDPDKYAALPLSEPPAQEEQVKEEPEDLKERFEEKEHEMTGEAPF